MKKSDLKKILKPLIEECIREAIFEEGVLSGLITEVAQGLGSVNNTPAQPTQQLRRNTSQEVPNQPSQSIIEAKNQLNEVKASLQKATGLHGVFEGTQPMRSSSGGGKSKSYGSLRDKEPSDAGVNIDGLMKMTGGWSHLT